MAGKTQQQRQMNDGIKEFLSFLEVGIFHDLILLSLSIDLLLLWCVLGPSLSEQCIPNRMALIKKYEELFLSSLKINTRST